MKAVFVFLHSACAIITLFNEFLEPPDQNDLKLQLKDQQAERQVVHTPGQL